MRPSFEIELTMSTEEILACLKRSISDPRCPCHGMTAKRGAEIFVEEKARHFWSPWLSLTVVDEAAGICLKGRFAPYPQVWMMYVGFYLICGFAMFGSVVFGYSQWMVGLTPSGLLVFPVSAMAMIGLFLGSLYGQHKSKEQMTMLRRIVDRAVDATDLPGEAGST